MVWQDHIMTSYPNFNLGRSLGQRAPRLWDSSPRWWCLCGLGACRRGKGWVKIGSEPMAFKTWCDTFECHLTSFTVAIHSHLQQNHLQLPHADCASWSKNILYMVKSHGQLTFQSAGRSKCWKDQISEGELPGNWPFGSIWLFGAWVSNAVSYVFVLQLGCLTVGTSDHVAERCTNQKPKPSCFQRKSDPSQWSLIVLLSDSWSDNGTATGWDPLEWNAHDEAATSLPGQVQFKTSHLTIQNESRMNQPLVASDSADLFFWLLFGEKNVERWPTARRHRSGVWPWSTYHMHVFASMSFYQSKTEQDIHNINLF